MSLLKRLLSVLAMLTVAACGGGGGSAGTPPFGPGDPGGGTPPVAADLVLVLSSASLPNDRSQTALATATALDANRNTLANVPVTISVDAGAIATASGSTTSTAGIVTAQIGIGSDTTNRTITVTATANSGAQALTRTATIEVRDPTPGGVDGPSLDVSLSSPLITPAAPGTVTMTLRSASGTAIPGATIALTTSRGNLATPSVSSVLTNSNGVATARLVAATDGLSGADELVAVTTVSGVAVTGQVGFTVVGSTPTIAFTSAPSTIRASTDPPATVRVEVRDAAGAAVANQPVAFSSANSLLKFSPASVLTNGNGVASTTVMPVDGSTSAADSVLASTTVAGRQLQSSRAVQIVGEVPSVVLTVSNSSITSTAPATARATVKDASGAFVRGAIVSFASQFGLAAFDATTASTDGNGVASVVVAPRSTTTTGADVVTATVTVGGVTRNAQAAVQFSSGTPVGTPVLGLTLSSDSISSASPATVTARLTDARGTAVAGQVIAFNVVRGLAKTNVATALTNSNGQAVVVLSPTSSSAAGADEVTASVTYTGVALQASRGFQVQATNVTIDQFSATSNPLSAYSQTPLTIRLTGASLTSPVNLSVNSSCAALGKASVSPTTVSTTSNTVTLQYRDNGCGALQAADRLQVVVDGTATSRSLTLNIAAPAASSLAFVQAAPEQIFLKSSGFTESSIVTFEVRDAAGNPLPRRYVLLQLLTGAGGVTIDGLTVEQSATTPVRLQSNAEGRVSVRVNSGSQPTPVRIQATLEGSTPAIRTVSSNLSVGIGLPSQLNFSLSQQTRNIEGYNIDGTPNVYQIIAADRTGNPVPAGTSINFVTEGGQVEAIKQTQLVSGIARTAANFVSSEPRPVDGRVTLTAYALGEESFIDLNGNNRYDAGEPFQDLGNVFKDRNFDGRYDASVDEFVPLDISNRGTCTAPGNDLLRLDASIPSVSRANGASADSCDSRWSGAGQVYVRRALETVLSTSAARPLWSSTGTQSTGRGLANSCEKLTLQTGSSPTQTEQFTVVSGGDEWYGPASDTLSFIVADANPGRPKPASQWTGDPVGGSPTFDPLKDYEVFPRLNPMAAGTTISVSTPTDGLTVQLGGGSPVPSTGEASTAAVAYTFPDLSKASTGVIFVTFRSPSGTTTTVAVRVTVGSRPTECPIP